MSGAGGSKPSWDIIPFVDNRALGSSHHTYKITPQRGVYGSMFLDDAMLAAAAPELLEALEAMILFSKPTKTNAAALNSAYSAIAKATGGANA